MYIGVQLGAQLAKPGHASILANVNHSELASWEGPRVMGCMQWLLCLKHLQKAILTSTLLRSKFANLDLMQNLMQLPMHNFFHSTSIHLLKIKIQKISLFRSENRADYAKKKKKKKNREGCFEAEFQPISLVQISKFFPQYYCETSVIKNLRNKKKKKKKKPKKANKKTTTFLHQNHFTIQIAMQYQFLAVNVSLG